MEKDLIKLNGIKDKLLKGELTEEIIEGYLRMNH